MGISFDPKKLLKTANLNPKEKILAAVNKQASALTSKLSGAVAGKLAAAGQSLKSATAFAAAKTDALLSSAPEAFTSMAALGGGNPAVSRISRKNLVTSRMGKTGGLDPQKLIPRSKASGSYSDTTSYPPDLGDLDYRLTLEFLEYKRPTLSEAPRTDVKFSISLPIPNTLMESYGVDYSSGQYGATLGTVINTIDKGSAAGDDISSTEGLAQASLGAARGVGQSFAVNRIGAPFSEFGVDTEGLSGLIDQTLGSIVNPHLSLFFKGVSLREHQFFWPFAPRSSVDSRVLKEIYYKIKKAALPAFTENALNTTLEYPMLVRVKIFTKGGKELYPFKMCVLQSCNLNYAASGTPAFHNDGRPGLAQLSVSLKEIEYFTSGDFDDDEYDSIDDQFAQTQPGLDDLLTFGSSAANAVTSLGRAVTSNPNLNSLFITPASGP